MSGIMQLAASIFAAAAPPGPPPPLANGIIVATIFESGYDWYGAYSLTGSSYYNFFISAFGTIASDYLYAVMYQTNGFSTNQTNIALNDGSYTGFTVTNGVIDGDLTSYPRVFTIGGTNYTFTLNSQGYYVAYGDVLSLASNVGATVSTVYNPAIQPSVTPNTIIVAQYDANPFTTYYGASKDFFSYGTVVSDYLKEIFYNSPSTTIRLTPGTYTGFTVDNDGLIDGDNTTARTFTVNSIDAVFTVSGSAPNYSYLNMGNPFSLNANVGNTLPAIYDPAAQPVPGPGEFASGNITVAQGGFTNSDYGWDLIGGYGSSTIPTPPSGPTIRIFYTPDPPGPSSTPSTIIGFQSGTFGSTVVVNSPTATVDGETQVTVTIDGVTQIGTLETTGSGPQLVFSGDVFSLQSKNTQTLAVTMVAGAATPGEVASGTITVGTDPFGPPGFLYGYWPGPGAGSSTIDPALVAHVYWISSGGPSGSTSIRLTAGTYGSVVVDGSLGTVDGETQLTMVIDGISQTGTLSVGGGGSYLEISPAITGDPYGFQSKNGQTLTVSVIAGAGGGGGTTYTSSGNWMSSGWVDNFDGTWRFTLGLSSSVDAGLVSALNALTVGSAFSATRSAETVAATVQTISGQPYSGSGGGGNSQVNIYTVAHPTSNWPSVDSITL